MSETGKTGYGLWPHFERDRAIYEARQSGKTYRELGEMFGISHEPARGACVRYSRFCQKPAHVQDILREIGRRGLSGLWNAFGEMERRGRPVSTLSELSREDLARVVNIGKMGSTLLAEFCEKNGDMTAEDVYRAMRGD